MKLAKGGRSRKVAIAARLLVTCKRGRASEATKEELLCSSRRVYLAAEVRWGRPPVHI
jgi:hypothetical protein